MELFIERTSNLLGGRKRQHSLLLKTMKLFIERTAFTSPGVVYRKDIKSIGRKTDRAAAKQMEKKVC